MTDIKVGNYEKRFKKITARINERWKKFEEQREYSEESMQ